MRSFDHASAFFDRLASLGVRRLHRRNPTAVRHRCAQRCDRENEHKAVAAMVRIVMLQR